MPVFDAFFNPSSPLPIDIPSRLKRGPKGKKMEKLIVKELGDMVFEHIDNYVFGWHGLPNSPVNHAIEKLGWQPVTRECPVGSFFKNETFNENGNITEEDSMLWYWPLEIALKFKKEYQEWYARQKGLHKETVDEQDLAVQRGRLIATGEDDELTLPRELRGSKTGVTRVGTIKEAANTASGKK